ncbi:hypothetical protein TEA_014027 [Camellia sinensis var. sinensis]|uniref:Malectin-like domain-containing protein n=1 Tax=Camellia sinensis var. sinensis TaxID=542762 RepID=A0A4S4EFD3_CAMSN|nr:hypothetical protein TEA_014027 [Camellia sinensis var. sinensis]
MKFSVCSYALVVVVVIVENSGISNSFGMLCGVPPDPTNGFTNVALTEYNFELQKPYDIPLEQRYSYYNGVRKFDFITTNSAFTRFRYGFVRSLAIEGYGFVPNSTSGATIVQIHGATNYTTTIILRIYNGDMRYYSGDLVDTDLYDKWFRVNLIHDVYKRNLTVFIDDGFTLAPLTEKNFWLQKPYNVPLDNRYSYEDEVRRLWVYNHDKPFYDDSGTRPTQKFALRVMITHLEYGNLKGIFMYQREHQVSP